MLVLLQGGCEGGGVGIGVGVGANVFLAILFCRKFLHRDFVRAGFFFLISVEMFFLHFSHSSRCDGPKFAVQSSCRVEMFAQAKINVFHGNELGFG